MVYYHISYARTILSGSPGLHYRTVSPNTPRQDGAGIYDRLEFQRDHSAVWLASFRPGERQDRPVVRFGAPEKAQNAEVTRLSVS